MDLIPTWLKRQGRIEVVRAVGYEGCFPRLEYQEAVANGLVFVVGLIFVCVNLLWHFALRCVVSIKSRRWLADLLRHLFQGRLTLR